MIYVGIEFIWQDLDLTDVVTNFRHSQPQSRVKINVSDDPQLSKTSVHVKGSIEFPSLEVPQLC